MALCSAGAESTLCVYRSCSTTLQEHRDGRTPCPGSAGDGPRPRVFCGDCLDMIKSGQVGRESVNLIVTSPPYADQRKNNYGGIHPDQYVAWFLPRAQVLQECLTPDGSLVLNIKEKALHGERHTYVLELILALRQQGWRWVDEYCWHKKNCYPGKWTNRFRDSWERLLHFTRHKRFKMRQEAVMVPMGDWTSQRLRNLSDTDRTRDRSQAANGFGKKVSNWVGRKMAYPTNVLHMATECGYKGASGGVSPGAAGLVHSSIHRPGRHRARSLRGLRKHLGGRCPPGQAECRNRYVSGILRCHAGATGIVKPAWWMVAATAVDKAVAGCTERLRAQPGDLRTIPVRQHQCPGDCVMPPKGREVLSLCGQGDCPYPFSGRRCPTSGSPR